LNTNLPPTASTVDETERRPMPRFYFNLIGSKSVSDKHGLLFSDVQFAADVAERLAAELFAVRPELRGTASVLMLDGRRSDLTYCVAIAPDPVRVGARPNHENPTSMIP
jgi:hypothetical protein